MKEVRHITYWSYDSVTYTRFLDRTFECFRTHIEPNLNRTFIFFVTAKNSNRTEPLRLPEPKRGSEGSFPSLVRMRHWWWTRGWRWHSMIRERGARPPTARRCWCRFSPLPAAAADGLTDGRDRSLSAARSASLGRLIALRLGRPADGNA